MLGTFLALIIALFLLAVPSRNRIANILMALFLVATAIDISAWFAYEWWNAHPGIAVFRPVFATLQMPLFAGFIWFHCFQRDGLAPRDAVHLLPALVVLLFVLADRPQPWLHLILEGQYLLYIGLSAWALWRVRLVLRAQFQGHSPTWRWLALLVGSSMLAHGIYVLRTYLLPAISQELALTLQLVAALIVLAITLWIAFQALLQPELFRGGDRLLASAVAAMETPGPSKDHDRLLAYMEAERPYLDPDMTVTRLARRSGIPAKTVSELINQRHGEHFFDFVNRYRIEHARKLLTDSDESVTNIIYASGFNAKSSFNTAFRKHAGMTPSAYRKSVGN